MTAQESGAARETRWEFPGHLSVARAVVVDTLPKVWEGYDPLEFWRMEKEVTSQLIRSDKDVEVRLVTFKFWQKSSIEYITVRLERESLSRPLPTLLMMPIFMEIGLSADLKKILSFSGTRGGIIRVQFKVVEHLDRRTHAVHGELAIAEVQAL